MDAPIIDSEAGVPTLVSSRPAPQNDGIDQPEQRKCTTEYNRAKDRQDKAEARHESVCVSPQFEDEGGDQKCRQGTRTGAKRIGEEGGVDHALPGQEFGQIAGDFNGKGDIGRLAFFDHKLLVSLSVSGVCLGIYTIISPEAGFGFALVYGLCWGLGGGGAWIDLLRYRHRRRPKLDPRVFRLLSEFSTGRLTLALVGMSFRFVLPETPAAAGIDRWSVAIMALALFSALQSAFNDISIAGLARIGQTRALRTNGEQP